jgi:hypothetical protein
MNHSLRAYLLLMAAVCAAPLVGCDDNGDTVRTDATTAPTVGDRVDRGLDKAGDAVGRAADKAGDTVGPAVDSAAQKAKETGQAIKQGAAELAADAAGGVHDLLAEVTEAAMTKGGMDDVVERLSASDRSRIGDVDEDNGFPQLNVEADAFRQKWQTKYNKSFDIDDEAAVFNFVTLKGDASSKDRATVVLPARGGMSELSVPVVREGAGWRIDVPDTVTAQQIADNLASGLRAINAGNPPLPDDVNEAYRSSAQGTMAALLGERRAP